MRKKLLIMLSLSLSVLVFSGCSVLMPYSSNLGPRRGTNQGYIGSVSQVYNETLNNGGVKKYPLLSMPGEKPVSGSNVLAGSVYNRELYYQFKNNLMMSLIGKRPTPIYEPPVILRVLMLPYVDNAGVLHSYQYIYFIAQNGRWLLGSYLNHNYSNSGKIFKPLSSAINKNNNAPKTVYSTAGIKKKQTPGGFFGNGKTNQPNNEQKVFQNDLKAAQAAKRASGQ